MTLSRSENRVLGANTSDTRSMCVEWLPLSEAAVASGYSVASIRALRRLRRVPVRHEVRMGSRGRRRMTLWHMPSVMAYRRDHHDTKGRPKPRTSRNKTKLGTALRDLRLDRGWTQEAVADALGVRVTTVSQWEVGTNIPRIRTIVRLAELYDMPLEMRWAMVEAWAWLARSRDDG
jgi:DNA-binding XRE family transcriptional regulator